MASHGVNQLPGIHNGVLVGVLSCDAITRYLEVRRSLGVDTPKKVAQHPLPHAV